MTLTPEEASGFYCPIARTFPEEKTAKCMGPECILWRWGKPQWELTEFTRAAQAALKEMKAGSNAIIGIDNAKARVRLNPEKYGLSSVPTHGYCGLGGRPE